MRKFFIVVPLLLTWACNQSDVVKIKGKIESAEGKTLYLDRLHVARTECLDSVKIKKNGTFNFKIKSVQPEFYFLRLSDGKLITLLTEPKEKLSLNINALKMSSDYTVTGSKGSQLVKDLNDRLFKTKDQLETIVKEIKAKKNEPNFDKFSKELTAEYAGIIKKQREFSINFVMKNATSMASYMALYQKLDDKSYTLNENSDIKYIKIVASSMKAMYPESEYTKALMNNYYKMQQDLDNLKLKNLIEEAGANYPEISLPNIKGDTINLTSLDGKFIVLDFWAAENSESRKANQTLKKIYKKYKNKGLEIYQVSIDRNKILWQNTVRADKLNWISVCDYQNGSIGAASVYNVQQLPANYLINKKGDIVGKNLFGVALEEKIDELMKR